jgi:ABC-2 type transport system permease protein
VLYSFTLSVASSILVYLICALFFGFRLQGSLITFLLVYLLVLVSIHAIGMAIAGMAKSSQMGGILASAFYFPMLFLSGATIPYEIMPKALQAAADFLPLTHGIKLLKAASMGQDLHAMALSFAVLAVIAVLGTFLSLKFFRWE